MDWVLGPPRPAEVTLKHCQELRTARDLESSSLARESGCDHVNSEHETELLSCVTRDQVLIVRTQGNWFAQLKQKRSLSCLIDEQSSRNQVFEYVNAGMTGC